MTKRTSIRRYVLFNISNLIAFLLFFTACQKAVTNSPHVKPEYQTKKFYIIGHRGAAGLAPENTIPAFIRAINSGVDAIELDVLLTADGALVVHHDFCLKPEITRKPDGTWLQKWDRPAIKNLTLKELKRYDVGRINPHTSYARRYPEQQPFDGEHIPTLREVISLLKTRVKGILADERQIAVAEKSAQASFAILLPLLALTSLVLMASAGKQEFYYLKGLGIILSYITYLGLLIYLLSFYYFNKKTGGSVYASGSFIRRPDMTIYDSAQRGDSMPCLQRNH